MIIQEPDFTLARFSIRQLDACVNTSTRNGKDYWRTDFVDDFFKYAALIDVRMDYNLTKNGSPELGRFLQRYRDEAVANALNPVVIDLTRLVPYLNSLCTNAQFSMLVELPRRIFGLGL